MLLKYYLSSKRIWGCFLTLILISTVIYRYFISDYSVTTRIVFGLFVLLLMFLPYLWKVIFKNYYGHLKLETESKYFFDENGFGRESDLSRVFYAWGKIDTIKENEKEILFYCDKKLLLNIQKDQTSQEKVALLEDLLSGVPVENVGLLK